LTNTTKVSLIKELILIQTFIGNRFWIFSTGNITGKMVVESLEHQLKIGNDIANFILE